MFISSLLLSTTLLSSNSLWGGFNSDLQSIISNTVIVAESDVSECVLEASDEAELSLYEYDEDLFARVVMAEAGGEDEAGKRLVIDCILNQVDSGLYGSTVYEVIYYKNNFESVKSGKIWKVTPTDDIYELIRQETISKYNNDVMYFRTKYYHSFGHKLFKHGRHYFSN